MGVDAITPESKVTAASGKVRAEAAREKRLDAEKARDDEQAVKVQISEEAQQRRELEEAPADEADA